MTKNGDTFGYTAQAPVVNHIRRLRTHGLSNKQIAERANVPRTTIANMVTNVNDVVNVTTARRIKDVKPPPSEPLPAGWWEDAACLGDPGPWVIEISDANRARARERISTKMSNLFARQLALCAECPVSHHCIAEAVQYEKERRAGRSAWGIDVSIRGGLFPHEIQELVDRG
jgi:hypothetical protein